MLPQRQLWLALLGCCTTGVSSGIARIGSNSAKRSTGSSRAASSEQLSAGRSWDGGNSRRHPAAPPLPCCQRLRPALAHLLMMQRPPAPLGWLLPSAETVEGSVRQLLWLHLHQQRRRQGQHPAAAAQLCGSPRQPRCPTSSQALPAAQLFHMVRGPKPQPAYVACSRRHCRRHQAWLNPGASLPIAPRTGRQAIVIAWRAAAGWQLAHLAPARRHCQRAQLMPAGCRPRARWAGHALRPLAAAATGAASCLGLGRNISRMTRMARAVAASGASSWHYRQRPSLPGCLAPAWAAPVEGRCHLAPCSATSATRPAMAGAIAVGTASLQAARAGRRWL